MSMITDSKVLSYLGLSRKEPHVNTDTEAKLVGLWNGKYMIAKGEYEASDVNSKKVEMWRNAYKGIFYELDEHGEQTERRMKALRKMVFELVEDKVDAHIPAPKMSPRYHSDLQPIEATEALIVYEMDKMLSEETHDESEHNTLIDSTTWFKVSWDPFENTHERSGMPIVEVCPIDTVYPQPGVTNYRKLEYIFERREMTIGQIEDLYDRGVASTDDGDLVEIIECYYLNQNGHVGKFVWTSDTLIVLANDVEWGMRRRRECTTCNTVVPIKEECHVCGSKKFKYVGVKEQRLEEDLEFITNPYRSGDSTEEEDDENQVSNTIPKGTKIPHYLIRQLPFVPKRNIKVVNSIYGISEVALNLEAQDSVNKYLSKAERKSMSSKAYVTKLKDTRIDDEDTEVAYIEVESAEEGNAMQVKQVTADIEKEMVMAQTMYANAKSTSGVTDTDQGKHDPSARSGKAKQMQIMASQERQKMPKVQRNSAYAGVYELIFKHLLAYSDEERAFVKVLPDGSTREEVWSKYMFLNKDKNGEYYYRDDYAWSVDEASEITQDRAAMWQLIDNDFNNGVMGSEIDPVRALRMYWHMKDQNGYPLAKFALAFLNDAINHLPTQIEQALVNNPDAVELALAYIADKQGGPGAGAGGARDGAGKPDSQKSKGQQQAKANEQTRAKEGQKTTTAAESMGGMQGGTEGDT